MTYSISERSIAYSFATKIQRYETFPLFAVENKKQIGVLTLDFYANEYREVLNNNRCNEARNSLAWRL